jgi:hypothetical protein
MMRTTPWFAIAVALALAGRAAANDSAAELAAGGIVLVKSDAIAMQREDLTLSPAEVRVRYEMRNDTGQPVTLRVAFPMPEVPSMSPDGMTLSTGTYNGIAIKPPTDPNFMDFRVWTDQRELKPEVEIRANLPDGRDITAGLTEIGGLPLVLQPGLFDQSSDRKLDAETRRKLRVLGAIEEPDATTFRLPWVTHVTFHWTQTFAPGVTVIEHAYRPVLGFRLVVADAGRPLEASGGEDPVKAYCIDPATEQAIRAEDKRVKATQAAQDQQPLFGYTLGYILQTARNWHGPIGAFHLAVQGGPMVFDGRPRGEVKITSLCTDLGLSRTGPQRFEATARDYMPKADLRVLFIAN